MKQSNAGFGAFVSGALVVYLLGALLYCSAEQSVPADQALTRGVGVAAGAAGIVFVAFLMRYLDVVAQRREASTTEAGGVADGQRPLTR